jgi:hypothetical protein
VEAESEVVVWDLTGQLETPGTLGKTARKLGDAGINIAFVYLATGNRAVLATSDNGKARQLLGL